MNLPPDLYSFCLGMGLLFAAVIGVALAAKWIETRRARTWQMTRGVVTRTRVRSRKRFDIDGHSRFENEPWVTYEYQVSERSYRASRINFAERISGPELVEALRRYPVGKRVQVYYNPLDPKEAVLERTLPRAVALGAGFLAAGLLGAALLFPLVLGSGAGWLATWMPKPENALFVALAAEMGIFSLLIIYASQRQAWASKHWRAVEGRVLSAQTETYQGWVSHGSTSQATILYRSSVVYAYSVDGQQYLSDRVSFGGEVSWGSARFLKGSLKKYPEDSLVTVFYDPENPGEAVLERKTAGFWILLAIAAGMFLLAAWAGGWI